MLIKRFSPAIGDCHPNFKIKNFLKNRSYKEKLFIFFLNPSKEEEVVMEEEL